MSLLSEPLPKVQVCECMRGGSGNSRPCGVVWCGVVWCGVVWCGVVWCGVVVVVVVCVCVCVCFTLNKETFLLRYKVVPATLREVDSNHLQTW